MKFSTAFFFSALAVLGSVSVVSSCSKNDNLTGAWQGNPTRIDIRGAEYATTTFTLDFAPDASAKRTGTINISAVIDVEQAVNTTIDSTFDQPYITSVAGTASITGHYAAENDDDDDIIISFDPGSFTVNVDPDGVTFSENVLTGHEQSSLDSISKATAERLRIAISTGLRDELSKYTRIEDIKIHHNDMLSCEIADRDHSFRKVQ